MSRQDFIDAAASEKITLCRLQATKRFVNYTFVSGSIYVKNVPHFVSGLKDDAGNVYIQAINASVSAGEFYYDVQSSNLYVHTHSSVDPNNIVLISTVQKFYSTHPIALPHDIQETSYDVYWDGRIEKSPNFKTKIGIDQALISTIGTGTIQLTNTDGGLDDIYDDLVFENQIVDIYSANRKQPLSEVRLIFTGIIHDKSFSSESVSFIVKDQLFNLLDNVPQGTFNESDNVNTDVVGRSKRWVYGRVDGLKAQSIDQIGEGYPISGTVSSGVPTKQQTKIDLNSSNPNDYNSKYILVNQSGNSSKYYLWWDVNNTGTDPNVADRTAIEVNLLGSDGINQIIEKTAIKLTDSNFEVLNTTGSPKVLFNTKDTGDTDDASNINAPVTVTTTINGVSGSQLFGVGTSFISDTSPGDAISIGTQEFKIDEVRSDTEILLDDEVTFQFVEQTAILKPDIPTTVKNRDFFICEHATAQLNRTVTNALQFNRVQLNDTTGILSGDILEFTNQSERVEVKNVAPGNIVVLQQNLIQLPNISDPVVRQPIQDVYIEGTRVQSADYTLSNTVGETRLTLDTNAEINITPIQNLNETLTFTNGSNIITGGQALTDRLQPRDYIRPEGPTYDTFYEILSVDDTSIKLRTTFVDPTTTDTAEIKTPAYVGDNTIVSVNLLGKTVDGTPTGEWIQTSAQTTRDLISEIGLTNRINEQSFTDTGKKTPQLVSMMIPSDINGSAQSVKDTIDRLTQSTNCSLSLDNNLELTYKSTLVFIPSAVTVVGDSDVVRWSVKSKSGKLYKFSKVRYRHTDIDRATLTGGTQIATKESSFVRNYVGTSKTIEKDVYLYNAFDALIFAERVLYYNSLSLTEIVLETDLRLEGLEIGDVVQLEFDRLYKRFGDNVTRKKLAAVSGRTVTGDRLNITLTDYGNTFNTSAFITQNTANNYGSSDPDDKLKQGYITDTQGVTDGIETTVEINKIS
jgi:hypothetical protein